MNDPGRRTLERRTSRKADRRKSLRQAPARADGRQGDLLVFGERQRREFDANPRPIRVFDLETLRFLAVNDAALALYGYSREEFLTLTLRDTRHPDEHDKMSAVFDKPTGYLIHVGPVRHVKKSGDVVIAEVISQDVLYAGRRARVSLTIDVTERTRVTELLEQRKQEFETLAEGLPDPVARFDREGRYVYLNSAVERLTGLSREAMLGRTQRELGMPEAIASLFERSLLDTVHDGEAHKLEFTFPQPAGERLFEAYHVPERNAAGAVARVLCVARDITERKRAEETLRNSEARFELAVETTGLGMWDWNVATSKVWRHPRWARILGYEPDEVPAHICMWQEFCHPEDWPQAQQLLIAHFEGKTSSYRADYRMRNKEGAWIWIGCRGQVIERNGDGEPVRMVGYIRNIGDRMKIEQALRESEERFRQLAENIREVFWINTFSGNKVLYVSPAYEEIWGMSCESLYRDPRSWMDPVHPDDRAALLEVQQKLAAGQHMEVEYRIIRPDGTMRWIRDRSYPMRGGDGAPLNCGIAEDITSRRREQEERFTHAIYQRDALVREVHHRIKNHLQGIAGLLRNQAAENPAAAETIEAAVAQLQSVAVVYGLQSELAESGVPLCRVLDAICSSAEGLSAARIERGFSAEAGEVRLAETEAVPVAVALNELVFNAIEHGGNGLIEVAFVERKDGADIRIVNPGRLPARFDYARGRGTGTGLELVRTLLGPAGVRLEFGAGKGRVEVTLSLRQPLVTAQKAAASARGNGK